MGCKSGGGEGVFGSVAASLKGFSCAIGGGCGSMMFIAGMPVCRSVDITTEVRVVDVRVVCGGDGGDEVRC